MVIASDAITFHLLSKFILDLCAAILIKTWDSCTALTYKAHCDF